MSAKPNLLATLKSLRRQLADAEAVADALRAQIAKDEARITGVAAPVFGLELLWDAALPTSRQRSSKHRCRAAWARIPKSERPHITGLVNALKRWNECDQWSASDGLYAPGLHRFISERMWECLPEKPKAAPMHRNMSNVQPVRQTEPGITDPAEIARLLGMLAKPKAPERPQNRISGPEQIAEMLKLVQASHET